MKGDHLETPEVALDDDRPPKTYVTRDEVFVHGLAFVAAMVISVAALGYLVWDLSCSAADAVSCPNCPSKELWLITIAVVSAWMGGLIHAGTSFATFAGNRQLMHSWLWWFYLRPPIGALLGVLVYLSARAASNGEVNTCADVYRYALLAGVAGLFSKQASDKLSDLVDSIFSPSKPPVRYDPLDHRQPTAEGTDTAAAAAPYAELIQWVQRTLIELGYLPKTTPAGQASDNGVLGDDTRAAVEAFLKAEQFTREDRLATLGEETDPDYWAKLLQLLIEAKSKGAATTASTS